MPPKKKKTGGDAAKGEKVFKNLCSACHSLSVRTRILQTFRHTRRAPRWEGFPEATSPREKGSTTRLRWQPRLL